MDEKFQIGLKWSTVMYRRDGSRVWTLCQNHLNLLSYQLIKSSIFLRQNIMSDKYERIQGGNKIVISNPLSFYTSDFLFSFCFGNNYHPCNKMV